MAKDELSQLLFGEGRELVNIKFLINEESNASAVEVRQAAADALNATMAKGHHHETPLSGIPKGILANN